MEKTIKSNLVMIIKSTLIAVLISVVAILGFAILLKFIDMSDLVIKIINQIIKIISIFFGNFILLKNDKSRGLVKGLFLGIMYTLIAFVVFSMLNSSITFGFSNLKFKIKI